MECLLSGMFCLLVQLAWVLLFILQKISQIVSVKITSLCADKALICFSQHTAVSQGTVMVEVTIFIGIAAQLPVLKKNQNMSQALLITIVYLFFFFSLHLAMMDEGPLTTLVL